MGRVSPKMFNENKFGKNLTLTPLVSIIIPTSNSMTGTKNIDRTLKSLMDQTYKNIEILVIDNFSKDATPEVCKSYPIRFFCFNGNRSKARNYGINRMLGDYVLFVDSDHILTPKVVEDCIEQGIHFGADCVLVPVKFVSNRKSFLDCSQMRNIEYKLGLGKQTCLLFYSKSMIQNIRYYENVELFEDAVFSSEVLKKQPRVSRIRSFIYHIEDGTIKNLILRSWNYGKKLRFTVAEIGFRDSTRFILDLSALNVRTMTKSSKIILNDLNSLITMFHFLIYILLKHFSFGVSYCLSLMERS